MIVTRPQLVMFTGTGATKSLASDPNDAEARLFRNTLPRAVQIPAGKIPASLRLMAASPNVNAAGVPPEIGSVTASRLLTAASESEPSSATALPQQGTALLEKHWLEAPVVTHVSSPRVGLPPPLVKSKVTRR